MKSKIIYSVLLACGLCFGSCSEDEIEPKIDITSEYDYLLNLTKESIHADTIIAEWYKKYDCAALYSFEEKDFRWLWAGKFNGYYELLDISQKEDSMALETMVKYVNDYLIAMGDEKTLKKVLPFRIYFTKEFHEKNDKSSSYLNVAYNEQDALMVGYLNGEDTPYAATDFEYNLNGMYIKFSYNALDPKPKKFIDSREKCKSNMVLMPENSSIQDEEEWKKYPDFLTDENGELKDPFDAQRHQGCVLGFVASVAKKVGTVPAYVPDEATDYGDYLSFITKRPGSYIRERTQYYWRMAKRGGLLIEYYKEYQGEDLIATQNANFPDDKVTLEDFSYDESRDK